MTGSWSAGAARLTFPVAPGEPMAGYAARSGPATGTLDELTVGAWYLAGNGGRFVLVAADLAAVDSGLVDEVAEATGLDRTELALCASHSHSGPIGVVSRLHPADPDQCAPALRASFVQRASQAIEAAKRRLEPVDLLFGRAETHGLAANRNAPDGPFDPALSVLATRNRAGRLASVLVHFACHPTILSSDSRVLSADFPGALRRETERLLTQTGDPPVVLSVNGAAGDVSTRFTRLAQDPSEVERVGHGLAQATLRALESAREVGPGLGSARVPVTLDLRSLDDSLLETEMDAGGHTGLTDAERRMWETRAQGAVLLRKLTATGGETVVRSFELPAWQFGEVGLVAIPGELFASLGREIAEQSPGPELVLGYANGYAGYLVDTAAYEASTYEALASPFAPGTGETVRQAAISAAAAARAARDRILLLAARHPDAATLR
ncbi:MAG: neutral/alkaline non-lysosomal ceramidase N-terminal domain-containing protein [Thermomicrobiales bacterium]|nr:neutral/alkaline non-lysosomal ceramidase N-terminal domain-containing protein [Thermomicrobiales bacterium]